MRLDAGALTFEICRYNAAAQSSLRRSPSAMKSYIKSNALSGVLTRNSGFVTGGSLVLANNGNA